MFGGGKFSSKSNQAISKSFMMQQQGELEDYNMIEGKWLKNTKLYLLHMGWAPEVCVLIFVF